MNNFLSFNPVFIIILLILIYLTFLVLYSSNQVENYQYFNQFFCSGWAGECISK